MFIFVWVFVFCLLGFICSTATGYYYNECVNECSIIMANGGGFCSCGLGMVLPATVVCFMIALLYPAFLLFEEHIDGFYL